MFAVLLEFIELLCYFFEEDWYVLMLELNLPDIYVDFSGVYWV